MANETHQIGGSKGDEELKAHERSGDEEPRDGVMDARK
jgi:hypothetical protein